MTDPTIGTAQDPWAAYRLDLKKVDGGVWNVHEETGDEFLVARAYNVAAVRYEQELLDAFGGRDPTVDERRDVTAKVLARHVLVGWRMKGCPDFAWSEERALAMLRDPENLDLLTWVRRASLAANKFKKTASSAVGN